MFINLTDVLRDEDKTVTVQIEPEMDEVTIGKETFPVVSKMPFDLVLTNIGKGEAQVTGSGEITFSMRCSRCLREVEKTLEISLDRTVFSPDREASPDERDDQGYMSGYQMDVEDLLCNEIVINWPMKVLCKPDCRGICRQCGQDLNTGTCNCDTFVPDPRMAVIKDIFNGNKEV